MTTDDARVRVASCRDPAEVALVRAVLNAHDIHAVVLGENHAALMGGLGGFISLDVWVERADAERASELIRSVREGAEVIIEDEDGNRIDPATLVHGDEDDEVAAPGPVAGDPSMELRRRTGAALLLSLVVTFGTGHMYAGAWLRGITLAAIEIVGFGQVGRGAPELGAAMIALAIAYDAIGSVILVRRAVRATYGGPPTRPDLPRARVIR